MEVKIPLGDGSFLTLVSKEDCKLDISYRDSEGNIYVSNNHAFKNNDSLKDFVENLKKDKPKIKKKDGSDPILKIESTNEEISLSSLNPTTTPDDEVLAPPPIISTENISIEKETPQGDDNKFYEEFKILKEQKEEMIEKNLELRGKIEKAKKETDELLRVFYENRAKYYEAEKRNERITKILKE